MVLLISQDLKKSENSQTQKTICTSKYDSSTLKLVFKWMWKSKSYRLPIITMFCSKCVCVKLQIWIKRRIDLNVFVRNSFYDIIVPIQESIFSFNCVFFSLSSFCQNRNIVCEMINYFLGVYFAKYFLICVYQNLFIFCFLQRLR